MELSKSKVKTTINLLLLIWGVFTVIYIGLIFAPSSAFVNISDFHVDDIRVGEYAYVDSVRDAKINLGGTVIEEIDMVIASTGINGVANRDTTEVMHRYQRDVFTEKSIRHVRRRIDYKHTMTGNYELYLRVTHDLNFLGIKKVTVLHDTYKVY